MEVKEMNFEVRPIKLSEIALSLYWYQILLGLFVISKVELTFKIFVLMKSNEISKSSISSLVSLQ